MRAQNVYRQAVKYFLMVLCSTVIVLVHLGCSLTGIEQKKQRLPISTIIKRF